MNRFALFIGIALGAFASGVIVERIWKSHLPASTSATLKTEQRIDSEEWPLTKQIVSRSLQSHSFTSSSLRRNSNDEIVWRWLKESISTFPQNWVKLNISNDESYGVVLYPPGVIEPSQLNYYNTELETKGLPPLKKGKRYQAINVYQGNIICPSWAGLIDVEEAKLVYFAGTSG
jgi:hypothetical protein